MPLLDRKLSQEEIDSLVRYGIDPDLAKQINGPEQDPNALQTLSRDGSNGPAPAPISNPGNQFGTPAVAPGFSDDPDVIASLTAPIDPYAPKPKAPAAPAATPPPTGTSATPVPEGLEGLDQDDIDAAVRGDIRIPGWNTKSGFNPSNPYAREGMPGWAPPKEKDLTQAVGESITDAASRRFGDGETNHPYIANPSNTSTGPAVPKPLPGTGDVQAHAAAQAAAATARSNAAKLDQWSKNVTSSWDGYINKPYQDQMDLVQKQADMDQRLASDLAKGSEMQNAIVSAARQRDADAQAKDAAEYQKKIDEVDRLNKEVMNTKIDPKKFWAGKSSLDSMEIMIGSLLAGAAGDGKVLSNLINQDLQVQQANLDTKKEGVKELKGTLAEHYKNLGNISAAREAARTNLIDSTQNQIAAIAKQYQGEGIQLKAQALTIDLQKARGEAQFKFWQYMNPDPRFPKGAGGFGKAMEFKPDHAVTLPSGTSFYANSPKEAEELRQAAAAMSSLDDKARRVKELADDPKAYVDGRLESAQLDLALTAKTAGMNSDKDFEVLKKKMGVGGGMIEYGARQILGLNEGAAEAVKQAKQDFANKVSATNGPILQTGFITGPDGLPRRVAIPTGETTGGYGQQQKQAAPPANAPSNNPGAAIKPGPAPSR